MGVVTATIPTQPGDTLVINGSVQTLSSGGGGGGEIDPATKAQIEKNTRDFATLNGTGTGSVKATAANEVAKVVASAPAKFDTLKEIADWIENDTTGAAKMANDIKDLKDNKANKNEIPSKLSDLTDDVNHRLVTDEEKTKWNSAGSAVTKETVASWGFTKNTDTEDLHLKREGGNIKIESDKVLEIVTDGGNDGGVGIWTGNDIGIVLNEDDGGIRMITKNGKNACLNDVEIATKDDIPEIPEISDFVKYENEESFNLIANDESKKSAIQFDLGTELKLYSEDKVYIEANNEDWHSDIDLRDDVIFTTDGEFNFQGNGLKYNDKDIATIDDIPTQKEWTLIMETDRSTSQTTTCSVSDEYSEIFILTDNGVGEFNFNNAHSCGSIYPLSILALYTYIYLSNDISSDINYNASTKVLTIRSSAENFRVYAR